MGINKTILKASKLTIGYKEKEVLSELNLELKKGQLTCLLGPNGAGKSTLIKTLTGIQKALSGTVELNDQLIQSYNQKQIAHQLSLVLTDRMATGNLTVYALVSLGRFPYTGWLGTLNAEDQELIQWALEVTGTTQFINRHIGELSDGEKQKVMIARALVQDTDIIILDEPTAHLDSPNRIEIFHLLRELTLNTSKTILISTHEIDMAIEHSDNMWLAMPNHSISMGLPEDLILNMSLEKAFGSEKLSFDYMKGKFRRNREELLKDLSISGNPIHIKWTQSALERAFPERIDLPEIEIKIENERPTWVLPNQKESFNTIAQLINYLKTENDEY
ncbi:ABC transporter ATP-binding protein [Roseivirga sp.]|uniref:ABC transporter ATP-binding protein n=1 Tax=Roseivirga sp. TaxID=1964215 RepID=UPI003B8D73AC